MRVMLLASGTGSVDGNVKSHEMDSLWVPVRNSGGHIIIFCYMVGKHHVITLYIKRV